MGVATSASRRSGQCTIKRSVCIASRQLAGSHPSAAAAGIRQAVMIRPCHETVAAAATASVAQSSWWSRRAMSTLPLAHTTTRRCLHSRHSRAGAALRTYAAAASPSLRQFGSTAATQSPPASSTQGDAPAPNILTPEQAALVDQEKDGLLKLHGALAAFGAGSEDMGLLQQAIKHLDELFLLCVVGKQYSHPCVTPVCDHWD